MRRLLPRSVAIVLAFALTAPALAQPTASDLERAKASFRAGANAYAAGDYLAAIQALEAAYALSPLPAIAFSLAQAERKQFFVDDRPEHLERALELFQRYLEQEPRGARREDARLAIAQLEPLRRSKPASEVAKQPARPTRLMIVCDIPGAQISLDGGPPKASPLIREVSPGKHRARVTAPGFVAVERDVTAVAGELLLSEVELQEKPSLLYVWAPLGSDIYVDGVYVAGGGERVVIPVSSGQHQLAVAQKGRRLERRDFRVQRGRAHVEHVTLERTTQRILSEYLFMGGGAALGAGLVWSAFAVRAENNAEDFLRDVRRRGASSAELVAYQAAIVERNRFRTAATVGVAGGFGLFITGLFLHELDQPGGLGAPQRGRADLKSSHAPTLRFTPVAAATDLGASLQLKF